MNKTSYGFGITPARPDTTCDVINFYETQNDTVIYRKIGKDMPELTFQILIINSNMYSPVKEIVIKDSESKKIIQTLTEDRDSIFVFNMEFNDYNFDGYLDFYLTDACAILGNCYGQVYIFNPDKKIYVRDRAFDEMTSIQTDKDKKEIYSLNRCCAGASSISMTFKYSGGKLYKSKQVNMDYDGKSKFIYNILEYNFDGRVINKKTVESEEMGLEF
ncbi:MAG: hypothetical protein HY959_07555 [Ignavibacteriae bacterium]|nr:hypothetical protein [Ignavibacteriota bacterium]